ncbi:MAG: phosphoglycerate mutase family protein [Chloroflexi bacterium OLB15]|nr:MAG: phosphoglycerate mutase family protein [Chloroflexi bacterium OLB15]
MELYIIRHGQSVNNALPDDQPRVQDASLTELGQKQAERLAAYLADGRNRDPRYSPATGHAEREDEATFGITNLYCSPMHRALQTTLPVAAAVGLKPEVWIDIHEHGGVYQATPDGIVGYTGRTRAQVASEFPDYVLPEGLTENGWWNAALGSEPYYTAAGRAIKVAAELKRRALEAPVQPDGRPTRIVMISHGTFIDALIKALLNQLPNRSFFYLQYNTGITRIDFVEKERLLLRYINRVPHLTPDMIS